MRSTGGDIIEFFGFTPDDQSSEATKYFNDKTCPFVVGTKCSKFNHDKSQVYGTCAVSGSITDQVYDEVIICPKRLYADNYNVFNDVILTVWGSLPLVVGGKLEDLKRKAVEHSECVVAFGQDSGREISVNEGGKLSMDWVLQRYKVTDDQLLPIDFVGIEIQSIDTTNNYRDNFGAYAEMKNNTDTSLQIVPLAKHGLNWANVHKRLIPQIIRKGNIYSKTKRCVGFFFILPEKVYQKFEEVLGEMPAEAENANSNLSVLTYKLGPAVKAGEKRTLQQMGTSHLSLVSISNAFSKEAGDNVAASLDQKLTSILI